MSDLVERLRKGCSCGFCRTDRCECATMDEAADRISELEAQLAQARGALEDAKGAIGRLDCTVFGPILSGHAEHLGWVRDQLLDKIIRALSEEGV